MPLRNPTRRPYWWALCGLVALVLAACGTPEQYPQSTLHPKGDFAEMVDGVFQSTVFWATIVFVLVEGALLYALFRFRGKPDDPEPKQIHGNTTAEIIWTAIPAVILAMIAVPTVRAIFRTYEQPAGDALQVEVIGHQWWWEFKYPEFGVTTANELHVPAGRTVALSMKTMDVLHSFWVPQFAGKRDVFPNRNTTLWFKTDAYEPGKENLYSGQCAEFCGIQHGRMAFHVRTHSAAGFDSVMRGMVASGTPAAAPGGAAPAQPAPGAPKPDSVRTTSAGAAVAVQSPAQVTQQDTSAKQTGEMQRGRPDTPAAPAPAPTGDVAAGEKLFLAKGCVGCHSLDAKKPMGVGPNLAGIGARGYIAAGQFRNTDENLARWIREPQAMKQGVLMPNLGVKEDEARALVAYLRTK